MAVVFAAACGGKTALRSFDELGAGGSISVAGVAGRAGSPSGGRDPGIGGSVSRAGSSAAGAAGRSPAEVRVDWVPAGWEGPIAVREGPTGIEAPACEGAYALESLILNDVLTANPPGCGCECLAPQGAYCGLATFDLFATSACTGVAAASLSFHANGPSSCFGALVPSGSNYASFRLRSVEILAQSEPACTPVGAVNKSGPFWQQVLTGCGPAVEPRICGDNDLCLPAPLPSPAPSLDLGLCIYKSGKVACPRGGYDNPIVGYLGFDDSRSCSECTCSAPSGICSPQVTLTRSDPTCTSGVNYDAVGQCRELTVPASRPELAYKYNGEVTGAKCAPFKPSPIGDVQPADPVTLCCDPLARP